MLLMRIVNLFLKFFFFFATCFSLFSLLFFFLCKYFLLFLKKKKINNFEMVLKWNESSFILPRMIFLQNMF